ncbi:hypothetical protein G6F35_017324 [Rhizopus arrhizus]|nr:hypothetical protein G6F35_017324 [Rhizopus arrhizus]
MLIAAGSVEEACVLALQFERAARMQLLAMSAGKIQPIPPALGHEAHDWILTPKRSQVGFSYYARRRLDGGAGFGHAYRSDFRPTAHDRPAPPPPYPAPSANPVPGTAGATHGADQKLSVQAGTRLERTVDFDRAAAGRGLRRGRVTAGGGG